MKYTPNEKAVNIVEKARKDLECSKGLVNKAVEVFDRIYFNFDKSSVWGKIR